MQYRNSENNSSTLPQVKLNKWTTGVQIALYSCVDCSRHISLAHKCYMQQTAMHSILTHFYQNHSSTIVDGLLDSLMESWPLTLSLLHHWSFPALPLIDNEQCWLGTRAVWAWVSCPLTLTLEEVGLTPLPFNSVGGLVSQSFPVNIDIKEWTQTCILSLGQLLSTWLTLGSPDFSCWTEGYLLYSRYFQLPRLPFIKPFVLDQQNCSWTSFKQ